MRDHRMHRTILESARYREIVFVPDRAEGVVAPHGTSQVQLHGSFRMHGAAHDITLPIQVEMVDGQATATTHFVIPYVKWGMKNPSTFFLRVSQEVDIKITTHARLEWAGAARPNHLSRMFSPELQVPDHTPR
jgi:hypothetical protein